MVADTHTAAEFFASRQGALAAHLLRQRLQLLWPSLQGEAVLGLGYAAPYLRLWREQAYRCIALTPAQIGAARWPPGAPNLSCTGEESALPFPDLCFDRVIVVHGLEASENVRGLLREIWRVLKDDGRLMIVAPNRRGMWAHVDSTPFGQGRPYSPGQVDRLLAAAMFRLLRRDTALYVPPTRLRLVLRSARLWERIGRPLVPRLAGVILAEAAKEMYGAVPADAVPNRRIVLADAA